MRASASDADQRSLSVDPDLTKLETYIGYSFKDRQRIVDALTHPSFAYEQEAQTSDNQRLEFLGDAVLQLVVTEHLFRILPDTPEGDMTKLRAGIVCEPTLVLVARALSLGSFMRFGRGEELAGGAEKSSNLSDSVEAVLGAVFSEGGYEAAREVILRLFAPYFSLALKGQLIYDYKSQLYEWAQALGDIVPTFQVLEEIGPVHDRLFKVGLFINGELSAEGSGRTKKAAEQDASRDYYFRHAVKED